MSAAVFEKKPRWPGAPKICIAENLPSFKDRKEMNAFYEKNCSRHSIKEVIECKACGGLHVKSIPPNPSGDSSGKGRSSK